MEVLRYNGKGVGCVLPALLPLGVAIVVIGIAIASSMLPVVPRGQAGSERAVTGAVGFR
jgi:hypothetical protein